MLAACKEARVAAAWAAVFAATFGAYTQAWAQQADASVQQSDRYLFVTPLYIRADDEDRGTTDDGRGAAVSYGRRWHGRWHWEGRVFGDLIETGLGSFTDFYQYGLGLDAHFRFREGTSPFVALGAGAVSNDVIPNADDDTDVFGSLALGFVTRELGRAGLRLRGEARYVHDRFETGGNAGMNDWHIGFGVQLPLGRRIVEREVVREVVREHVERVPAEILDADGDGVPDQNDRCPGTLSGLATDNRGCAAQSPQALRLEGVAFEYNSARLMPGAIETLRRVAEALRGEPSLRAEIAGHTDSRGSDAYNLELSRQRASSVRDFLLSQGIAEGRLEARGYGETQPVADNSTELGRSANRRVEFRVRD